MFCWFHENAQFMYADVPCVQMCLSRRSYWILRILPLLLTMSSWGSLLSWWITGGHHWPPCSPSTLLMWSRWRERWWALSRAGPAHAQSMEETIKGGNLWWTLCSAKEHLFVWNWFIVACLTITSIAAHMYWLLICMLFIPFSLITLMILYLSKHILCLRTSLLLY